MTNAVSVLVLLAIVWSPAFFAMSGLMWSILAGIGLIFAICFSHFSFLILFLLFLIYLPIVFLINAASFRRRYLIEPMLSRLKKKIPAISVTEREAIEAGDTWWEKELFSGRPQWKNLFGIPAPRLSAEENAFLNHEVEQVCAMINDWQITFKDKDMPQEVWDYLKTNKFFGMGIPKQYGGLGFSALGHSTIIVKLATRSLSVAVNTMVPNSLGPAELLLHYGTEAQKNYYLPRLAVGEEMPCFALTAPHAGSDAGSITDSGVVCYDQYEGQEVLGIRLNWDKRYITLAPVATVLGVAFRLYDPDKLIGEVEDIGITLCLIPTSHPGVETGRRHYPLYQAFMNGPTRGTDVFIPLDWIIGGVKMAGQGWRMLMESLAVGRSISLPALATACGNICYRYSGAYAKIRKQFNLPLSAFEGIEEALGQIAGNAYLLEATRVMTAGAVDLNIKPAIASAIAKYHMTELSRRAVEHAMDVHGGHMIQVGPRNFLATAHIALPISITVEGANILTRNLIIFGQGAIRCHPYLLEEIELMMTENTDVKKLDKVLMSHVGFFVCSLLRNMAYGLSGGRLIFTSGVKHPRIKRLQRQLIRMSTALTFLADTSLILLGGNLKRRERISARLGDIMSQLYMASAILKYFHDHDSPSTDVEYVCWAIQSCLYKIQIACNELFANFSNPFIGKLLQFIIFPWGSAYRRPHDRLDRKIVESMTATSVLRERLTQYCYVSKNANELSYRLDKALAQVPAIDLIDKKIRKALVEKRITERLSLKECAEKALQLGILTSDEVNLYLEFEELKNEIVQVNEFSFDLNEVIL